MDHIKVAKAPDVTVLRLGTATTGTLHLTAHHMIFKDNNSSREIWICYPVIADVERKPYNFTVNHSSIRIRCRDFTYLAFNFVSEKLSRDVFESIMKLTCVSKIEELYAFMYKPGSLERKQDGWSFYDPVKEFERMGAFERGKWRWTDLNRDYQFSPSYPDRLVVPEAISDNVLKYGVPFRSKARMPALTYYHRFNDCTITRCAQPMVGIKQNRSPQDERIIQAIFETTTVSDKYGAKQDNLMVDARPTANAMAQTAMGAGTENMENYKNSKKVYLGIDNIHVMRDSLSKVVDVLKNGDISPLAPNQELLYKSHWLKHNSIILEGAVMIAQQVHYKFSHVVIHCSDGWDRTSQLSSIAQICLDPYFRTIDGFITLVEKDWLSFGYRFAERSGHLSNEKHFVQLNENNNQAQQVFNSVSHKLVKQSHIKYTSPVFHQFLDCVYQIMRQYPTKFEYNERFLRRLLYHTYSCQYGTFLFNCERERREARASEKTRSAWDYFLARKQQFRNLTYDASDDIESEILTPNPKDVKWWPELFGRTDQDMNRKMVVPSPPSSPAPRYQQQQQQSVSSSTSSSTRLDPYAEQSSTASFVIDEHEAPAPMTVNLNGDKELSDSLVRNKNVEENGGGADELPSFLRRGGNKGADDMARTLQFEAMSLEDGKKTSVVNGDTGLFNRIAESTGLR